MSYRLITSYTIILGFILYGCTGTKNVQNENISKTQSQESSAQTPIKYSLEKYPFPKDYKEAYRYRTNTPNLQVVHFLSDATNDSLRLSNPTEYLDNLSRMINTSTNDPFEKVKMIYDATALLLEYDTELLKLPYIPAQKWEDILISRKTVCAGYAILFKKICDLMNIPCEMVSGFAQGGLLPLSPNRDLTPNHAWNIVEINNLWYTIDCTWGSSFADMLTHSQTRKYNTDWLFLNSEHFKYTHFPTDSNFQLTTPKLSEEQFRESPRIEPNFFDRLELLTPLKAINEIENSFEIKLKKKSQEDIQVLFINYATGESIQNRTLLKQNDNVISVTFNTPFSGTFLGVISYNTEGKTYKGCAFFFIQAKSASKIQYPIPLKSSAKDVEIISPLVELQADSTYDFKIKVSNKKYMLLFYNGQFTRMKSQGNGIFTQKFTIPHDAKSIVIETSDSEYGKYEGIVKYLIEN